MKKLKILTRLNRTVIFLAAITLMAGWLRIWKLGDYPVSLNQDETVIGYDAYSILHTARDHHGHFLPLVFESIGDYKAPILTYWIIPGLVIGGLTEFGVRIMVAVVGVLTPLAVYWLVKELLWGSKLSKSQAESVALLTAFSVAISPWQVMASRVTHDGVLAGGFLIVGMALGLRWLRTNVNRLWMAVLMLVLSAYTYHAERLIAPLLLGWVAIIFREQLLKYKKQVGVCLVVGIIFSLPLLYLMTGKAGQRRAQVTSIARDVEISREVEAAETNSGLVARVFNHPWLVLGNFWVKRWLDYWNANYLFFYGADLTLGENPDVGLMYAIELPFFLLGIWLLVKSAGKYFESRRFKLVIFWLAVGPLAASLANNAQHPYRSLTWIPMPQLLVGIGAATVIWWAKKKGTWIKLGLALVSGAGLVYGLLYFGDVYWHHLPIQKSEFWEYGYKQLALYAAQNHDKYQEVIFDPVFGSEGPYIVGTPYISVLFYSQYDPREFQTDERRKESNFEKIDFSNYTFRPIYWPEDRMSKNKLFMGSPWSLPLKDVPEDEILEKIYFKNETLGFLIVETK